VGRAAVRKTATHFFWPALPRGAVLAGAALALLTQAATAADRDGSLKLNQIQRVGTAESYKLEPSDGLLRLIRMGGKRSEQALDFGQPSLTAQLDDGAGSLSFDIAYDPQGGLLKSPTGASMADELLDKDYVTAMSQPGFKVIHVLDVDYKSSCLTLKACLNEVAGWSRIHPDHLPLVIAISSNDEKTPMPGATKPLPFDEAAAGALEQEIQSVFKPAEIITPLEVKAGCATLRQAVLAGGWPSLDSTRGKVLFVFHDEARKTALYHGGLMFVTTDENSPDAGFVAIDDPLKDGARIAADVKAGFIVLTRADADTVEARANDTRRRDAAFASGAQVIQTDFLQPDKTVGPYQAIIPGGRHARCDAVIADCTAWNATMLRTATAR
jgi:hypothetical protein